MNFEIIINQNKRYKKEKNQLLLLFKNGKKSLPNLFWGAFLYDYKRPCHCWKLKTAKQKKISENLIKDLNIKLESATRQR